MKISLNLYSKKIISSPPDLILEGLNSNLKFLIYGKPLLFKSRPFDINELNGKFNELNDLIVWLTGNFIIFEEYNGKVIAFSIDLFGQTRYYYSLDNESINFASKVDQLQYNNQIKDYDYYQILLFLLKGYTWNGGTFFKQIKIVSSFKKYKLVDNILIEEYIKIPECKDKNSIKDVSKNILNALSNSNFGNGLDLMFSGGKDSTFIALALSEINTKFRSIYNKYVAPAFSLNAQDAILSSKVAQLRNLNYIELENNAKEDVKNYIHETIKLLPFEFHLSIAQRNIIKYASESGSKLIITG